MSLPSPSPAWTALGWTFLHMLWIGAVVGLAASLARRLLRRTSAEARHAAALGGLVLLSASPFAAFAVVYEPAAAAPPVPAAGVEGKPFAVDAGSRAVREFAPPRLSTDPSPPERSRTSTWFDAWITVLPGVWLVGSLLTTASLATGLVGVERLRRASLPLQSGPIVERCRLLVHALGSAHVGVAVCDRIASPMLIGVIRPLILLPTSVLTGWGPDQIEMALLHELAHLRRRDNLTSLFQRFAEALVFFHPATWWLSAWLRLERESCCDRLVVARTGRPRAYAELLAALAEARLARPSLALNERPITTRIRRILLKEDRPMTLKPTLPEALALCAATLLAAALTIPTHAEPPAEKPKADVQADLKRLADATAGIDDPGSPDRDRALTAIADAQRKLDDRDGALETLERVKPPAAPPAVPPGEKAYKEWVDDLVARAKLLRGLGRTEAASELVRRLTDELAPSDPDLLIRTARVLEAELAGRMNRSIGITPDGVETVVQFQVQGAENDPVQRANFGGTTDVEAAAACRKLELLGGVFEDLKILLSTEESRRIIDRLVVVSEPMREPIKSNMLVRIAADCEQKGDPEYGRRLLARAKAAILALPEGPEKDESLLNLVRSTAVMKRDAGEFLAIVPSLRPEARTTAVDLALQTTYQSSLGWSISSGYFGPSLALPPIILDPEAARAALLRIRAAAMALAPSDARTRLLDSMARVQAACGDFAGSLETLNALPDHAADGDLDILKPITLALVASLQAKAGDQAGADASFAAARALASGVTDDSGKATAWTVIAEKLQTADRLDAARDALAVAIPAAQAVPEPRRSRLLCWLSWTRFHVDGIAAAAKTVDSIRDEPGTEKVRMLASLAGLAKTLGDLETSRDLARRALPLAARPGEGSIKAGWSIPVVTNLIQELDRETPADIARFHRAMEYRRLADLAGAPAAETEAQLKLLFASDYKNLSDRLLVAYRSDGVDAALKQAEAVESIPGRFRAIQQLAKIIAAR